MHLSFSKQGSSKPITTTKLEVKPCQIPSQGSVQAGSKYYPLERDYATGGCTNSTLNGIKFDGRYK